MEIDSSLIPILKDTLKDWDNVSVINNDIPETDIKKIADEKNGGKPVKVVANLPYYITTPIIMGLLRRRMFLWIRSPSWCRRRLQTSYAGWSRYQGLRCAFPGCAVLCEAGDRCECTAELFYAAAEGWKCGDQADAL